MNILIAPNSMKGSLNAFDFADVVEDAFLQCSKEFKVKKVPVADGGDFTGEVLSKHLNARKVELKVKGPLGETILSKYYISENSAIIEMADASGMKLVDRKILNPLKASSYGTGELIADAVKKGCDRVLIAIGGSASVDGGMGLMQGLGYIFYDENGVELEGNGENLTKVRKVYKPAFFKNISIKIICDVDNPLLGNNGAAVVFGPQKGATPEMVQILENGLKNWASILTTETGKDYSIHPGAGAAGGVSLPMICFLNAEIVPGADFILSLLDFDKKMMWADIVITGEGSIDSQTLNNKAPFAVAKKAGKYGKPVFAIGGKVEPEASFAFDGMYSFLNSPVSLEDAMKNTKQLLFEFSFEFAKSILKLSTLK